MEPRQITHLVGALVLIMGGASAVAYGLFVFGPRPLFAWAVLAIIGGLAWLWFEFIKPRQSSK